MADVHSLVLLQFFVGLEKLLNLVLEKPVLVLEAFEALDQLQLDGLHLKGALFHGDKLGVLLHDGDFQFRHLDVCQVKVGL